MALLTAEDVLNKAFQKTKYREGFDQDEVDEFLDEVADTIAALTAERDELQRRLAAGGGAPVAAAPATAPHSLLAAATDPNPPSATTMLAMAQKLHDDYVQAGEAERDRLMDEARAKAESIVEQAEKDARDRMGSLESERAELERSIDDLRRFERDYRSHLRNYLENLLGDLEHSSSKGASAPVTSTPEPVIPAETAAWSPAAVEPVAEATVAEPEPEPAPQFEFPVAQPEPPVAPEFPGTSQFAPVADFPVAQPAAPVAPEFPAWGEPAQQEAPAFPAIHEGQEPEKGDDAPRWNF